MAETKIKDKREYPMALPIGTMLKGGAYTYIIEEVLGQGGCGITYKVSTEIKAGQIPVTLHFAVKENFPDYCSRENDGVHIKYPETFSEGFRRELQDFLSEGRKLNEICVASNNIVKVNETWEENGTAYYAMAFIDGDNLQNYVREKKKLSEDEAIEILTPILDAVSIVHQHNMLHLDIKPENIMLEKKKGGSIPILIDFGISLHFDQNGKITKTSKGHSQGFSKCYAPLEQQNGPVDHFAPEMDVYALGATLYFMLVGEDPKNACDIRPRMIESALPQNILDSTRMAILHAMRSFAEERTQTVLAFKNKLKAKGESNINYRLSIKYSGDGRIFVNNTLLQNGQVYQVVNDPQRAISILPGAGYKVGRVRLNNDDVTRQMRGNILTFSSQIKDVELEVDFVRGTIIYDTKSVKIKSSGSGCVYYGSTLIRHSSRSFTIKTGSPFMVTFSPDTGCVLKSLKLNNVGVSIVKSRSQYTIPKVTSDTIIEVVFSKPLPPIPFPWKPIYRLLQAVGQLLVIFGIIAFVWYKCSSQNPVDDDTLVDPVVDSVEYHSEDTNISLTVDVKNNRDSKKKSSIEKQPVTEPVPLGSQQDNLEKKYEGYLEYAKKDYRTNNYSKAKSELQKIIKMGKPFSSRKEVTSLKKLVELGINKDQGMKYYNDWSKDKTDSVAKVKAEEFLRKADQNDEDVTKRLGLLQKYATR